MLNNENTSAVNHGIIEIHMLKSFPVSCLNRDDTGRVKTVIYGGTTRGRISSQSIKRAMRTSVLNREFLEKALGVRTRMLPQRIYDTLIEEGVDPEVSKSAAMVFAKAEKKEEEIDKKIAEGRLNADKLEFYSQEELSTIISTVVKNVKEKFPSLKEVKATKGKFGDEIRAGLSLAGIPMSFDQAMYGRMVTDTTLKSINGSVLVAHAISTNAIAEESDYFTAVDDLMVGKEMGGSGHIDDAAFTSATYYYHFVIDLKQLYDNLNGYEDREDAVRKVVRSLIMLASFTNPGGKQNSMEAHTLHDVMYVTYKERSIPTNLSGAYREPVYRKFAETSAERLVKQANESNNVSNFVKPSHSAWNAINVSSDVPKEAIVYNSLDELCDAVENWLC